MTRLIKTTVLCAIMALVSQFAQAQSPLDGIFKASERAQKAEEARGKYKVEANKSITMTKVFEGLNMDAKKGLEVASQYIEEAYQLCRFSIDVVNDEKNFVIAKGTFENFETYSFIPHEYIFNAPITIRFDAKEGRLRMMAILTTYEGTRMMHNDYSPFSENISELPPVNENSTEKKKMYTKVFVTLFNKVQELFDEAETFIQSHNGIEVDEDW